MFSRSQHHFLECIVKLVTKVNLPNAHAWVWSVQGNERNAPPVSNITVVGFLKNVLKPNVGILEQTSVVSKV